MSHILQISSEYMFIPTIYMQQNMIIHLLISTKKRYFRN